MTTTAQHCQAKTKRGQPCRAYALAQSAFCFRHDPTQAKARRKASAAGGRARHGRKILFTPGEPITLATVADVLKLLESEVNAVLTLEVSLSRGQTIARLAGAFVSAFQVGEIEQRLAALESSLGENNR